MKDLSSGRNEHFKERVGERAAVRLDKLELINPNMEKQNEDSFSRNKCSEFVLQ